MIARKLQSGCSVRVRTAERTESFSIKKDQFVIGRDAATEVRVNHFEVSRKHAQIRIVDGAVYVRDLGSSNGTFVAGKKLRPDEEVLLSPRDTEISLGDVAWLVVNPQGATNSEVSLPSVSRPSFSKPMEPYNSTDFANARIEEIQKDAIRAAEVIQAEARESALKIRRDAEQEAVAIREAAYKKCEEQLQDKTRAIQELTPKKAQLERAVASLTERSELLTQSCAMAESQQKQAEEIIEQLEKRRKKMEVESVESAKALQAATERRTSLEAKLDELKNELASSQKELASLETKLETETRRQTALCATVEAESRVKRLELEAAIGELELQRVEAKKRLQETVDKAAETQAETEKNRTRSEHALAEDKERMEALKKDFEAKQQSLSTLSQEIARSSEELLKKQESITRLNETEASVRASISQLEKKREDDAVSARRSALAQLDAEISARRKTMEEAFVIRRAELERELADAKLQELQKIRGLHAEEKQQQRFRRQFILDEILEAARALPHKGAVDGEFRRVVEAALEGKSPGNQNAEAARRSRRFWRQAGVYASIPAAIALFFLLLPGLPGAITKQMNRTIASEKKDSGVFLAQIQETGLKYQPPQDRVYRDTYSDNILYLKGYVEMKQDPGETKRWTLMLNDFIVGRLGLSDRTIPELVSAETVMIQDLLRVRETILKQFKSQGLARMAATEHQDMAGMIAQLQTEENYRKFREFEKSYYEDYVARKGEAISAATPMSGH